MSPDYSKRSYLLPKGCKDLIDVLKLDHGHHLESNLPPFWLPQVLPSVVQPVFKGELLVPEIISVKDFAAVLKCKPLTLIADLMGLGIFAQLNQLLDFATTSKVARKHGYTAKKMGATN